METESGSFSENKKEQEKCMRSWGDYPLTILIINPINRRLVKWIAKTNITPNQLTLISLLSILIGSGLMVFTSHGLQAFGGVLLLCGFLVDCLDGDLARYKNMKSPLGAMLDPLCDRLGECAILIGAAFSGYVYDGKSYWLIGGMVSIGASQIYFYIVDALVWTVPVSVIEKKEMPMFLGTPIRFGAIEPFMWGQAALACLGKARWGVFLFGVMFAVGIVTAFYRLKIRAQKNETNQQAFTTIHSK